MHFNFFEPLVILTLQSYLQKEVKTFPINGNTFTTNVIGKLSHHYPNIVAFCLSTVTWSNTFVIKLIHLYWNPEQRLYFSEKKNKFNKITTHFRHSWADCTKTTTRTTLASFSQSLDRPNVLSRLDDQIESLFACSANFSNQFTQYHFHTPHPW